jgi:HSP20 family molecular chaperone IbpA
MAIPKKAARPQLTALNLLQREVNQIFERLASLEPPAAEMASEWCPSVDVYERGGKLVVVLEVAGLSPEALRVICRERELVVTGERKERRPAGIAGFLCMERPLGRFTRAVPLDVAVDLKLAEARLASGLLTITLPRLKDRRGRETVIPIAWESEAS